MTRMKISSLLLLSVILAISCSSEDTSSPGGGGNKDAGTDAATCKAKSCQDLGKSCGSVSTGCGAVVDCGTCPAPSSCGSDNTCTCAPTTCQAAGKNCGNMPDGCGGTLHCGSCSASETCGGGPQGQANVCGEGPCTTKTDCAAEGKDCGIISDNCSDTLDCGTCTAPNVCGGSGTANVCGCTPTTCAALAKNCGNVGDSCGGTLSCGSCGANETCSSANVCVSQTAPSVQVAPSSVQIQPAQTTSFAATVTGVTPTTVTWSVQEPAGGTIDATSVYTAPATAGTYHVIATSVAAPTVSGSATVNVTNTGDLGDLPPWISALPTLSNGLKWMPGVPGGIPAGTLDTTLTASQMTTSGINSAIAAASGKGSPTNVRVVQLPSGTFSISGTIVPRNYVILKGAGAWGAGRTRLNFSSGGGIESEDLDWGSAPLTSMSLTPGGTLPVGSTSVPVASAAGVAVGDLIQLDQLDDLSYVAILDAGYNKRAPFTDGPYNGPLSSDGFRSVASMHQVTAINGATLTIDPPTRIAYSYYSLADGTTQLKPQVWRVSRRGSDGLWWFGLESVSIAGPHNGAIVYNAGAFNWVKDVETDGAANGGIGDDHVRFNHQFRSEVRRVYAHHTAGGPVSGGANYGLNLNAATSDCLVIDSIVLFMNKLIQTNACGPGNVIAYNYVDNTSANGGGWMDGAINGSHQSFSHNLLVEGNWSANIGCDTTHGVSGYMAFLRNFANGRSTTYNNTSNQRAANSDGWQREMAFIGNVLTTAAGGVYEQTKAATGTFTIWSIGQNVWGSGDDYDAQTNLPPQNDMQYDGTTWDNRQATFTTKAHDKLWRHGNWDSVHASIFDWDPAFPKHKLAVSLFLSATPSFFGSNPWPWINATGATASDRVATLPAKARYDAGTPFAP